MACSPLTAKPNMPFGIWWTKGFSGTGEYLKTIGKTYGGDEAALLQGVLLPPVK
ncbi:MAG: hypothetical protein R2788_09440 [Saprospiraceae bacterium]